MTKTTIFSIVALVAVLGTVVYVSVNKSNVVVEDIADVDTANSKKMAFSDFLKQKGSYKCDVVQYIDEGYTQTTEGEVFISNGLIRGDFKTNAMGIDIETSMIVKDDFVYSWTNMSKVGFKVPAVQGSKSDNTTETYGEYTWNSEKIGDYQCESWTPDMNTFELPASIQFADIAA